MKTPRKKADRASFRQIIAIAKRLTEVLKVHDDGIVSYKDNHTDESVAKELDVGESSVKNVRHQEFGRLYVKNTVAAAVMPADIKEMLDTRLTELSDSFGDGYTDVKAKHAALLVGHQALNKEHLELKDRFNRLLDNLTMNKIIDVKHLRLK